MIGIQEFPDVELTPHCYWVATVHICYLHWSTTPCVPCPLLQSLLRMAQSMTTFTRRRRTQVLSSRYCGLNRLLKVLCMYIVVKIRYVHVSPNVCVHMNAGRLPQVSPLPSLLVGMNYLHQKDIIHRDLKSTNSAFCRPSILSSESIIRDLAESNTPTHTCTARVK